MNEKKRSEIDRELEEAKQYLEKVVQELFLRERKVNEGKQAIAVLKERRNEELSRALHGVGSAQAFLSREAYRKRINKEIEEQEKIVALLMEDYQRAERRLDEVTSEIEALEDSLALSLEDI